jgi:6-phospho-3-hexuloisomerase
MSGPLSSAKELAEDVQEAISSLDETQIKRLVSLLVDAKKNNRKVFLMGEGLSDLVARAFALRLAELTFNVYVIGETVTSAVEKNDLFIAVTRSGVTPLTVEAARIAKDRAKAKIVAITSSEDSPMIKLADYIVMIKFASAESEDASIKPKAAESYLNIQLTGSVIPSYRTVFQIAATCVAEAIVSELSLELGIDSNQ